MLKDNKQMMKLVTKMGAPALVVALIAGVLMGVPTGAKSVDVSSAPKAEIVETIEVDAEALEDWQAFVDTEEGQAYVLEVLQDAFPGADVGIGHDTTTGPAQDSSIGELQPVLAYGFNATHFWITMSYADVARGAISVGVRVCSSRLPVWLCRSAGSLLSRLAQGYGPASNHGIWAAVYWAPPRVTGGRW